MSERHTLRERFRLGRVTVTIEAEESSIEDIGEAAAQMKLLSRLLQGLATDEEAALSAKILNGPTMDSILARKGARPCGCRGKK